MAGRRTIDILVQTDGTVQIDAVGFKGPDCAKATKFLEAALGKVAKVQKKPEFDAAVQSRSLQRVGG